jgi:hypothetical protein
MEVEGLCFIDAPWLPFTLAWACPDGEKAASLGQKRLRLGSKRLHNSQRVERTNLDAGQGLQGHIYFLLTFGQPA